MRPPGNRLVEHRQSGFDPVFRHWLIRLVTGLGNGHSPRTLALARLEVREDPARPGGLLVTVRGDARVTHDGRDVEPLPAPPAPAPGPAVRLALSGAAKASRKRRQCPSCRRGGGLAQMADGSHKCRWCALVVEREVA